MLNTGPLRTPRRVSVSTWALHTLIGITSPGRPGDPSASMIASQPGTLDLLDVPAELARRGIHTMELCHFHLPSREPAYLDRLKTAIDSAGVELWNLLIDDGDITHPEDGARDAAWALGWIDTAAHLGAKCARVIAGKQEATPANVALARERLLQLVIEAYLRGVHLLTENWFSIASRPEYVEEIFTGTQGALGLCLDFGNWNGPTKYEDLAAIAPFAVSCHAKCSFTDGQPDADDFRRCLEITRAAVYSGPYTLVYGEPGDVWGSIEQQREILGAYL